MMEGVPWTRRWSVRRPSWPTTRTTGGTRSGRRRSRRLGGEIIEALRTVYDPEIPVNIYELGLIYKIDIEDDDQVLVEMTLTSPHCPVAETLPGEVEHKVAAVDGVAGCEVKVVWDPPWNPVDDDRGSAARARDDLLSATGIQPSRSMTCRTKPHRRRASSTGTTITSIVQLQPLRRCSRRQRAKAR